MSAEALRFQPQETVAFKETEFLSRLNRWRDERPFLRTFWEWNARRRIVNAMKNDLKNPDFRKSVQQTKSITQILENRLQGKNLLSKDRVDSVTKEPFVVEVIKDTTGWVAQERKNDTNSIISQARIEANGNTFLTLNFQGPRYERSNANPGIFVDPRFPQATTKVFNFLAASVLS